MKQIRQLTYSRIILKCVWLVPEFVIEKRIEMLGRINDNFETQNDKAQQEIESLVKEVIL